MRPAHCASLATVAFAVACGGSAAPLLPLERAAPHARRSVFIAAATVHEQRFEHAKAIALLQGVCDRDQDFELCRRAIAAKKMPVARLPSVDGVCSDGVGVAPATVLTVTLPGAYVDGVKIKPKRDAVAEALAHAPSGSLAVVVDDRVTALQMWPIVLGVDAAQREHVSLAVRTAEGPLPMRLGALADAETAQVVADPNRSVTELAAALAAACPAPTFAIGS